MEIAWGYYIFVLVVSGLAYRFMTRRPRVFFLSPAEALFEGISQQQIAFLNDRVCELEKIYRIDWPHLDGCKSIITRPARCCASPAWLSGKKIFLISPVRTNIPPREEEAIANYVALLRRLGCGVYWPKYNTLQTGDPIGIRIITDNRRAIRETDYVLIWWIPGSEGSLFDLGIARGFGKKIFVVNAEVMALPAVRDYFKRIKKARKVFVHCWLKNAQTLYDLGIAWAMNKPILLTDPSWVKKTEGKSFENVLLYLHGKYE